MFVKCNPYIYLLSSFMCPAGTRLVFIKTKRNKAEQEKDKAKTKVNFFQTDFSPFFVYFFELFASNIQEIT